MLGGNDTMSEAAMPHQSTVEKSGEVGRRLYTIPQIIGATVLGTPLAGCLLMAKNYRTIDRRTSARQSLIFGAISSLGVVVLALALPDSTPDAFVALLYTAVMSAIATVTQAGLLRRHFVGGGARQSNWSVLGIGIASLVAFILFAAAIVFVIPESIWVSILGPSDQW